MFSTFQKGNAAAHATAHAAITGPSHQVVEILPEPIKSVEKKPEVELLRWTWDRCDTTRSVFVYGCRGSGKTFFLRDMMYNLRKRFHSGMAVSPTLDSRREFERFMPGCFVHPDIDLDVIQELILIKQELQKTYRRGEHDDHRNVFLLLDDCSYDKKKMNSKEMAELLMNGRHSKIFTIATLQWMKDLEPRMRENFDYIFLFQADSKETREKLYDMFGSSVFENFDEFDSFYRRVVCDRRILVFDRTSKSPRFEDKVFFYKAKEYTAPFYVGVRSYWLYGHYYSKDIDNSVMDARRKIAQTLKPPQRQLLSNGSSSSSLAPLQQQQQQQQGNAIGDTNRVQNVIKLIERRKQDQQM